MPNVCIPYYRVCHRPDKVIYKSTSPLNALAFNSNWYFSSDIGDIAMNRTAVALVNGDTLWHMHKPLTESCNVQLLHYNVAQPAMVNKAFWRTCSFLLGAVISKAFKDTVSVQLHSFPIPNGTN